jgi:hypothetical protein
MLENIMDLLPFLIPLVLVELGLLIAALVHILRHRTYRVGNRALWLVISIVLGIIGPVLYFVIGKGDE